MRKIILIFSAFFLLQSPCYAVTVNGFTPLIIPFVVPELLSHPGPSAVAGLYYWMQAGLSSLVGIDGGISRPSAAAYIDLTATPPAVVQKNVTAHMPLDKLKSLARANPSTYPKSKAATDPSEPFPHVSGEVCKTPDGQFWKLGSLFFSNDNSQSTSPYTNGYSHLRYNNQDAIQVTYGASSSGGNYSATIRSYYATSNSGPVTTREPTPSEVQAKIAVGNSSSPLPATSAYQAELDKMMQDPSYVPTFTDDTTGLPDIPPDPSHVATPAQVATYNSNGQATASAQQAASSASAAAGSAQTAATNAANAYAASGGNPATGSGGDSSLYQKYLDAKSAADKAAADAAAAQAAADKLNADQTAQQDNVNATPFDSTKYGDGSSTDFGARFKSFFDQMKTTAVFSIPQSLSPGNLGAGSSVFTANCGRFGTQTVDLAQFASAWLALRSVCLILSGVFAVKILTLKGGA